jgi:hypothetical protein
MKNIAQYSFLVFILIYLFSGLFLPDKLAAQDTDSTATEPAQRFLIHNTTPGGRSSALGNSSVADYTELSSIYINPAVLSRVESLKRIEFNSNQNWNSNLMLQNFTAPFLANNGHRITLQTGILHKGWGSSEPIASGLTSSPSFMMYRFDLAYAYSFTPTFSMGFLNSTSIAQKAQENYTTNVLSFGLLYAPSKSISYGVAFRGLGRNVGYEITENGETELITLNKTESLEVGATLTYPIDTDRTYFSLSLANERRFVDSGNWYKFGFELKLGVIPKLPKLHVRNGMIMQPEFNVYAPTFGLGMDFEKSSVSFSISPGTQLDERFHQLGVIIHLDKF